MTRKPTLNMTRGLATAIRNMRGAVRDQNTRSHMCLSTVLMSWREAATAVPTHGFVLTYKPQADAMTRLPFVCEMAVALRGARDVVLCISVAECGLMRWVPR